jgi:two-component system response regulator ResD
MEGRGSTEMADRLLVSSHQQGTKLPENSEKVLIVDDDDAIRTMVERILRRERFHVESARDGFEAIEKLSRNEYSAILLDLMMPRVDGLQVLRFLEAERNAPKPWVIVMTANTQIAVEAEGSKPLFRVLSKPFDIRQLVDHVRECATLAAENSSSN